MSWDIVKLGDVLTHRKGTITIDDDTAYKLCRVQLHRKGVVLREVIKGFKIRTKKQQVCNAGDFLVAEMDAKLGGYGFVPTELDGAIVSSHYFLFELDTTKIRHGYLEMVSQLNILQKQIKATGSTNYAAIRPSNVMLWEIPLPPISEQVKIEELFRSAKEKSSKLNLEFSYQLELVKHMRQSVLMDALQGKMSEQNSGDGSAKDLLDQIKSQKITINSKKLLNDLKFEIPFSIPVNWVWCRLGSISSITRGKGPKYAAEGVLKMLNQKCVREYIVDKQFAKPIDRVWYQQLPEKYVVRTDDVLVNSTGEGTIGRSAIADESIDGFCFDSHILKVSSAINQQYVCYFINSPLGQKFVTQSKGAKSTKQTELGVNNLSSFYIPVPPLKEQSRIVSRIQKAFDKFDLLEACITQNMRVNNTLLHQALVETLIGRKNQPLIQAKEDNAYFKRAVLATYIINQSLDDDKFGDVKFEKILHLSDYHAIKRNLGQAYYQQAAGPYDNGFTLQYFPKIIKSKWFNRDKKGNQFTFSAGQNHGKSTNTYNYFSDTELKKVTTLISYFKKYDYEQPEIVSTLYAVWNNRIIKKDEINDDLLIQDFYNWDKQKAKYERKRLVAALGWMRKENIVPDGWGKLIEKAKAKAAAKKSKKTKDK